MNFGHLNFYGLAWLWQLVSFALVVYFVLRFLRAIERGVEAHERIAHHLTRLNAAGSQGGTGPTRT